MVPTKALSTAALLLVSAPAPAQTLYALRASGDLLRLDPATGAATPIGPCGVPLQAAGTDNSCPSGPGSPCNESVFAIGTEFPQSGQILWLNRWTGSISFTRTITGIPAGYQVHALAPAEANGNYATLRASPPSGSDLLARIASSGACMVIGPTGRSDLEALAGPAPLYALGTGGGGTLCILDPATGASTAIGGGTFGEDTHALGFNGSDLLAAGANLRRVDPATGATTLIGPTGYTDLRGVGAITRAGCYAACGTWPNGIPAPFTCFLTKFATGDPWANCDQSTTPPILNVADFTCFLQKVAAGC